MGPLGLGENEEDPEFGAYTVNSPAIDSIVYHAQTYLPVFSSGNSANQGGPVDGQTYTAVVLVPDPSNPGQVIQNLLPGQTAPRAGTAGPPLYPDPNGGNPDPDFPNPVEVNQSLERDFAIGKGISPGLDNIKSTGVAKNNLTVGAIYTASDEVDPQAESVGLSHFSSRGPIDDGRVKPDLVAPSTFEPIPPGGFNFGGTSSAVPAVVGTLALLQEINANSAGPRYLASSWKALLLNTAMDCTDLSYLLEEDPGTGPIVTRVTNYFGIKPQVAGGNGQSPVVGGA